MKLLLMITFIFSSVAKPNGLDQNFGKGEYGSDWIIINDGVMGGLSAAKKHLSKTSLQFKGNISLDNNGGFSSIRSPFDAIDLSDYKRAEIRYRSRHQKLDFTIENDQRFYRPNFKYELPNSNWEWTELSIDLYKQNAVVMGRPTEIQMTSKYLSEVIRIGFICANKTAGPFEFEVDYVRFK